jgi:hypothetical protein
MHAYLLARLPAEVIPMPRIDHRAYAAAKDAVRHRCNHLRLCDDATERCEGRAAALIRTGRSAATAVAEGIKLAKRHPHRALLQRAERPLIVPIGRLANAAGWLFVAAVLLGFLARQAAA